jgi:endogenous inhibitor of DNA gyrase (YacG/DUF329 family)
MPSGIKGSSRKYNCLHCNNVNDWGWSKTNKFCNNRCQQDWVWENETKPRIEAGDTTSNSVSALKRFLIEKFGENCFECGLGNTWQNKKLVLQLEHADGNSDNNLPTNLKLLCPNCHTQTETFGCKGQGNRYQKDTKRNRYLREYKASVV